MNYVAEASCAWVDNLSLCQISELDFQDSLMTIGFSEDVIKEILQVRPAQPAVSVLYNTVWPQVPGY